MKALKILFFLLVLIVLVVVGGATAFVALVDPNDFKDQISEKVLDETGRTLTLEGDIEWAFWPKIKIKAGPLRLSNAPGFGDAPFFAAQEFQVAIATLPLLKNQFEMDTVKLYGAEVNLAKNADGVTNWDDLAQESSQEKSGGDIATIALGGVDIQNANLKWRDATSGQTVDLNELTVSTGALTFGDPIAFEVSLGALANQPALDSDIKLAGTVSYNLSAETYHVEPLNLDIVMRGKSLPGGSATVSTRGIIDVDLKSGVAKLNELTLNGLGTDLVGQIEATQIESGTPGARGTLNLKGTDLALLFQAFELPVAKQIASLRERSFNFNTEFDANMESGDVTVSQLVGQMLGANLNATISAARANTDKPAAKGNISASGPDLPSLLAIAGQLQGMEAKTLSNLVKVLGGAKDKTFDLQSTFDADMDKGLINVPTLEAKLLGNAISGNVASKPSGDKASVAGNVNASGPDLPSLLAIVATFQGPESGLHEMSNSLSGSPNQSFKLTTSFESDADSGVVNLPQLSASGLGLKIDGQMKGQNMESDNGTLDGRLAIKGNKLTPLLRAMGQQDLAKSVKAIDIDAGIKGTMANLTLSPLAIVMKVQNAPAKKPVNVTLTAKTTHANLDKETLSVDGLSLKGLGMNITGNVNASKIKTEPKFEGKLNVPAFNLRNVMRSLSIEIPPMASQKSLTKFGMTTKFNGSNNSFAMKNLLMNLDGSNLTGNLSVANFESPAVRFDIDIDRINADNYLAPTPKGKSRPITPEAAAAGAAQLPVKTLRGLDINGNLAIKSLQISGAKMSDLKIKLNAKGGVLRMNPVSALLYQGKYSGDIKLNAKKKTPKLNINSKLTGANIESLLFDTTGDRVLSGIANVDAKLRTNGRNSKQLTNRLSGPLQFSVLNGVYRGIDIANMLAQIEIMIESKRPGSIRKGGETRFQSLGGTINFKNGVGTNNDLLLDGSGFKITGKGTVANLRNNTMKYNAKVAVDSGKAQRGEDNYNLGGYTVPIRCRGKLGADACKPDVGNIVAEIGKNAVRKEIGKQLEKAIGGDPGKALKDIFKF